jgi:hypothetical protein
MASGTDEALKSTGLVLAGNKHVYEIFSVEFLFLGCSDMLLTSLILCTALSEKLYVIKGGCGAGRYLLTQICQYLSPHTCIVAYAKLKKK